MHRFSLQRLRWRLPRWLRRRTQNRFASVPVTVCNDARPNTESLISLTDARPPTRLFGREHELAELVGLRARATLVVGDSGIGKSRLLAAAVERLSQSPGDASVVYSSPVRLTHRPGALQTALLEGLGLAVAIAESEEPTSARWQRIFKDAMAKVAENRVRDMVAGAQSFMLGVIRARLGDEAADIIADAQKQLTLSAADQLSERIVAASDPDVLAAFKALASAAARLAERPLVLAIDGVERLSDTDFRMLLDLIDDMPAGLQILLAHSTRDADDVQRIRQLDEVGAKAAVPQGGATVSPGRTLQVVRLAPLSETDVEEWMLDAGLNPASSESQLDDVVLTTGGYPLYVDQALRALVDGRGLGSVVGEEAFVSRSQQNYAGLDLEEQRVIMLLSAFTEPPDLPTLLELTGLDEPRWAVLERRLIEARILVTAVSRRPWFHELGRRAIWSSTLTPTQRASSAAVAFEAILGLTEAAGTSSIQDCMDLARLCAEAPALADGHELLAASLDLAPEELAVLAALIELDEDANQGAISLGHVFTHARQRFGLGSGISEVVEGLENKGFVVTAENDQMVVVVPVWRSAAARMAVIGRIASDLARVPVPSLASQLVGGYLLPTVGEFHAAAFGLGNPSVTELARRLQDMEYDRTYDAEYQHVSHEKRPGLVIRTRLGELSFYASINFTSTDRRDDAFHTLEALDENNYVMGEPLHLDVVLPWPADGDPVAPLRFTRAAELATGEDLRNATAFTVAKTLPQVLTLAEELELEMRAWRTIRDLASSLERHAMDIDELRGLVLTTDETQAWIGEIRGRDDLIDLGPAPESLTSKRMFIQLEALADLEAGQRIGTVRYRGAKATNPVPDVIATTRKRLLAFNQAQATGFRLVIPEEEAALVDMLQAAHEQRYRDAVRLVEDGMLPRIPGRVLGRDVFAIIQRAPAGERLRGFEHSLKTLSIRAASGAGTVRLRIVDEPTERTGFPGADEFRQWFDVQEFDPMLAGLSSSVLAFGLAAALAHEDVRLPERYWPGRI